MWLCSAAGMTSYSFSRQTALYCCCRVTGICSPIAAAVAPVLSCVSLFFLPGPSWMPLGAEAAAAAGSASASSQLEER